MSLENIDRLDGVTSVSFTCDPLHLHYSVHNHVGEELRISDYVKVLWWLRATMVTYAPMILEAIDVLAAFTRHSRPSSSTLHVKWSWMYRTASLSWTAAQEIIKECVIVRVGVCWWGSVIVRMKVTVTVCDNEGVCLLHTCTCRLAGNPG